MATKARIEPLKGSVNWSLWRIRLKALLSKDEIGYTIKPKKEFPKSTAKEIIEEYTEKRNSDSKKAAAIIRLNLADSPLIQTQSIADDDAEALYDRLEALYAPKGFSTEFIIAKELFNTSLTSTGSIENYLAKIRGYTDELALRNKPIPKAIIAAFALNNLTSEYGPIIAAITTKYRDNDDDDEIDLDDLFNAIIDESRRLKISEPNETALYTRNNSAKRRSKSTIRCFNCDKLGHYAKECRGKPKEAKTNDYAALSILDREELAL